MRWARIVAVQAFIAFALLEIGLRLYNPIGARVRGSEIVLPVKHTYRFDNGTRATKIDRVTVHTRNTLGFRGPDPPRDFESRLTLLTVGGSTTESLFLSDGRTWTDVLARTLEPQFPHLWVNNAGLDGHTTFGHLVLVRSVVARLRPKVVIFLVGANDVALEGSNTFDQGVAASPSAPRAIVNAAATHSEVVSLGLNMARALRARDRGLGHSEVDLRVAPHLVLDPDVVARTEAQAATALPGFQARLEQLVRLTRDHGILPVLMTQPALFGEGVDPETGVQLATVQVNGRGNGHLEWRLLEQVNDVTRRVAQERQVLLVDLARELPKDSRFFYDFLHFTNAGSERVGGIVAAALAPYLRAHFSQDQPSR
jgi:lysophospholipase L1-like esterase